MFAPFTVYGLAASELALNDAGYTKDVLDTLPESEKERTVGIILLGCDSVCLFVCLPVFLPPWFCWSDCPY